MPAAATNQPNIHPRTPYTIAIPFHNLILVGQVIPETIFAMADYVTILQHVSDSNEGHGCCVLFGYALPHAENQKLMFLLCFVNCDCMGNVQNSTPVHPQLYHCRVLLYWHAGRKTGLAAMVLCALLFWVGLKFVGR